MFEIWVHFILYSPKITYNTYSYRGGKDGRSEGGREGRRGGVSEEENK